MATFTPSKPPKPIEIDKFLGLNESVGDTEITPGEAIYMRNFRITPNNKLEKRSGHTTWWDFENGKAIQCIWEGKIAGTTYYIAINDGKVYRRTTATTTKVLNSELITDGIVTQIGTMTDAKTKALYFDGKLLFFNGTEYKYYDGTTFGDVSSIAYVPTIAINAPPTGGGTLFEEINLLTGKKKQTFQGNGTATAFQLAETSIDAALLIATVNGVSKTETTDFTVNRTTGVVTFSVAPASNAEVIIQWEKASTTNVNLVVKNRFADVYGPGNDTTIFIWGNPDQPNRRTRSGTLDPTYWPVNNFTLVGSDQYAITDIVPQYDRQIIFKEDRTFYSNPEYDTTSESYIYPVFPLNYAIGNVSFDAVQVVRNNPVSLYGRNLWEWVNTQIKDERNAQDRSEKMVSSFSGIDFTGAVTFDNQDGQELWINVGSLVYIWNYDVNAWYVFDNVEANVFSLIGDKIVYGTKAGKIEMFKGLTSDNDASVNAIWKSGFMDFGLYEYKKTSRDMWFVIQPASRTSVDIMCPTNLKNEQDPALKEFKTFTKGYALFDFADINFGNMSFKTNRNPQTFRFKIKAKKYTSIQVIIGNSKVDETLVFLGFKIPVETGSFAK